MVAGNLFHRRGRVVGHNRPCRGSIPQIICSCRTPTVGTPRCPRLVKGPIMFSRTAISILLAFPTALVVALAPAAHADVFDMCPGGHEGVVGGHTTCDFA